MGTLTDIKPALQAYFKVRRFTRNSFRSYTNYLRILLLRAAELGWAAYPPEIAAAWQPILAAVAKSQGCSGVELYAIRKCKVLADFTDEDLDCWCEESIRNGRTYKWVVQVKGRFRKPYSRPGSARNFRNYSPS